MLGESALMGVQKNPWARWWGAQSHATTSIPQLGETCVTLRGPFALVRLTKILVKFMAYHQLVY